jgi:succinoglycan biosynthesis protein ExoO
MSSSPKASVIIPVHNAERFLETAIRSVLHQSFQDFEIIVVDDASTDRSSEIINSFRDPRIRCVRNSSCQGSSLSRNRGISISQGEWIVLLDADDAWHPERLTRLMEAAAEAPSSFIATESWICFSDPDTAELLPWRTFAEDRKLKWGKTVMPTAAEFIRYGLDLKPMFPRKVVEENGIIFDPRFAGHEWLVFLLRLYSIGLKYIVINEPMYFYRIGHASLSTMHEMIVDEIENCRYLLESKWIDEDAAREVKKLITRSKYRLFVSAFRERRWKTGMSYFGRYPGSVFFMLKPMLRFLRRRNDYRKKIIENAQAQSLRRP